MEEKLFIEFENTSLLVIGDPKKLDNFKKMILEAKGKKIYLSGNKQKDYILLDTKGETTIELDFKKLISIQRTK